MPDRRGVFEVEAAIPVMAAYGRAIASGQLLEVSLAAVLGAFKRTSDPELTREEWVAFTEGIETQALGRLKNLFADLNAPGEHVKRIESALRTRNFLVHNCFREPERLDLMFSEDGRRQLEEEFIHAADEFRDCSELMAAILIQTAIAAGFDPEHVIDRVKSLVDREPRDSWERRVKAIVSNPQRRKQMEEQFQTLARLMSGLTNSDTDSP